MKESIKRILALVLSFVMIFTSLPMIEVYALGNDGYNKDGKKEIHSSWEHVAYTSGNTTYNAYDKVKQGEEFVLLVENKNTANIDWREVATSEFTGQKSNWTLKHLENFYGYSRWIDVNVDNVLDYGNSNIPESIKEDAQTGKYELYGRAKDGNYGKNSYTKEYKWHFEVVKAEVKVTVKNTLTIAVEGEETNSLTAADVAKEKVKFGEEYSTKENEINKDVKNYVKESFELDNNFYTLKEGKVEFDKTNKEVKVSATYTKTPIDTFVKYTLTLDVPKTEGHYETKLNGWTWKKVWVEGQPVLTVDDVTSNLVEFNKEVKLNGTIEEDAEKYLLTRVEKNGKKYKLVDSDIEVGNVQKVSNIKKAQDVKLSAKYVEVQETEITIEHKLSFVVGTKDECANMEAFKIDEPIAFENSEVAKFADGKNPDYFKDYAAEGYDYAGQYEYNQATKTVTLKYNTKKVTINYSGIDKESTTEYINKEDLKNNDFTTMTTNDFAELFLNKEEMSKNVKYLLDLDKTNFTTPYETGVIINAVYSVAKYTVTFMQDNEKLHEAEVAYGQSANRAAEAAKAKVVIDQSKYEFFNGWYCNGQKVENFNNITDNMVVNASIGTKDMVTVKHVYEFFGELQLIQSDVQPKTNNYLIYALDKTNAAMLDNDDSDKEVTIKYYANKLVVDYVTASWTKKGIKYTNIKDSRSTLIDYVVVPEWDYNNFDVMARKYLTAEDTATFELDGSTYTYNRCGSKLLYSKQGESFTNNTTHIVLVFDETVNQTNIKATFNAVDAYGKVSEVKELAINKNVNDKDLEAELAKLPKVGDKVKASNVTYEIVEVVNGQKETEFIYTMKLSLNGEVVSKEMPYYVAKFWSLTKKNVDGVDKYARKENTSNDWFAPMTFVTEVTGNIVTKYGYEKQTVDGMEFSNDTIAWSTDITKNGKHINGFYDAEDEKDGIVTGHYFIEGENKEYAQAEITFMITDNRNGALVDLVEYPNEDEEFMLVWNSIKLENGQYNVYGKRLTQPRTVKDTEVKTITVEQNLPFGLVNVNDLRQLDENTIEALCEKIADAINANEGALAAADKALDPSLSLIKIDEDYVEDYIWDDADFNQEGQLISIENNLISSYFYYNITVNFVERPITFSFSQKNAKKANVYEEAVRIAREKVNEELDSFEGFVIVNAEANDTLPDGKLAKGEYQVVVNVTTQKANSDSQLVKKYRAVGTLTATRSTSSSAKKTEEMKTAPLAGGLLGDLRTNRPNDNITRSEFVGVLSEVFTVLDSENGKKFKDTVGDANEEKIRKFSAFEIVKGYCEDQFGPNDLLTREQMYLILARAIKFAGKAADLSEAQVEERLAKVLDGTNVSEWATKGVASAIEEGLVDTNSVDPQGYITRTQTADKIEKFIAIIAETEEETK